MQILIDADACPVVRIVEQQAKQRGIPLVLFCDTNHVIQSDYAQVRAIGAGADAVDFALTAACKAGDVVITQDYGLAAMILSKGAYGLHQSGMRYTDDNIDGLLMDRHLAKKARMAKAKNHLKGPARRTKEDDKRFAAALEKLLDEITEKGRKM